MNDDETTMPSECDLEDFAVYCLQCTDRQVLGVLEKEETAGRLAYARVARAEARRRGLL